MLVSSAGSTCARADVLFEFVKRARPAGRPRSLGLYIARARAVYLALSLSRARGSPARTSRARASNSARPLASRAHDLPAPQHHDKDINYWPPLSCRPSDASARPIGRAQTAPKRIAQAPDFARQAGEQIRAILILLLAKISLQTPRSMTSMMPANADGADEPRGPLPAGPLEVTFELERSEKKRPMAPDDFITRTFARPP